LEGGGGVDGVEVGLYVLAMLCFLMYMLVW